MRSKLPSLSLARCITVLFAELLNKLESVHVIMFYFNRGHRVESRNPGRNPKTRKVKQLDDKNRSKVTIMMRSAGENDTSGYLNILHTIKELEYYGNFFNKNNIALSEFLRTKRSTTKCDSRARAIRCSRA